MKYFICTLYSVLSFSCTFFGAETIFVYGPTNTTSIKTKDCTSTQIDSLQNLLKESVGSLNSSHMKQFDETKSINLIPSIIKVRNLDEMITSRLALPSEKKAVVIDQTISDDFLLLNEGDFVEIFCNDCETNGLKNIRFIKNVQGTKLTFWLKVKILSATNVVVAKNDIPLNFNSTNISNLHTQTLYVLNPLEYVTNKDDLVFNRFNKLIKKNDLIKKTDLTPLSLVTYGMPVKVIMNSNNISLSASAMPLSNGFIGDFIRLKNIKTNNIFTAKIIGKNEVSIDL